VGVEQQHRTLELPFHSSEAMMRLRQVEGELNSQEWKMKDDGAERKQNPGESRSWDWSR
jgi:hypothetical protein